MKSASTALLLTTSLALGVIGGFVGSVFLSSKADDCTSGGARDVMVPVGAWCVDKYESSVCSEKNGNGRCLHRDNTDPTNQHQVSADESLKGFPWMGAPNDGTPYEPLYAASIPDAVPARGISWYQAAMACAESGKQLIPDDVWVLAAMGTPDSGKQATGGTEGGSKEDSPEARCNTGSADPAPTWLAPHAGVRKTAHAGSGRWHPGSGACISRWEVEDMIGNLWEWTATTGVQAGVQAGQKQTKPEIPWKWDMQLPADYGSDASLNVAGSVAGLKEGRIEWIDGLTAATIRGGAWNSGHAAGIYALGHDVAPSHQRWRLGFRCARPRILSR